MLSDRHIAWWSPYLRRYQAYAFKITVTEEPHFNIIKGDKRSRVQDRAITAEALLPEGPYNLWREKETSRRVKDLSGAFAQLPHLPKMLRSSAIIETLVDGCVKGTFVLRLTRPDGSFRTWWMSRPDENALNDPALELALSESSELSDIAPELLTPRRLPQIWEQEEARVKDLHEYFAGGRVVQVEREGYQESLVIPKVQTDAINQAICRAVENLPADGGTAPRPL